MQQIEMKLPIRGGKRKGAGRKPMNGLKAGVSHAPRPQFKAQHPVHVTMRVRPGVGFLRGFSRRSAIEDALREVKLRFGMRVVHYSIQGNHLHLIVEVDDPSILPHAIQGFAVRLARALNEIASRNGKVFLDRYHAHVLKTRREVSNAVRYVLENFRHHLREDVAPQGTDPCSSAAWVTTRDDPPILSPQTWLLRHCEAGTKQAVALPFRRTGSRRHALRARNWRSRCPSEYD